MKKLQDGSALAFITCVLVLTIVSIMGIWKLLGDDVITKSFQTVTFLAVIAAIVTLAGKFMGPHEEPVLDANGQPMAMPANPIFTSIRSGTVISLAVTLPLLAILGVMSIWEVLSKEVLGKSFSSVALIAFASLVVIGTCLTREPHKMPSMHADGKHTSMGRIILYIVLALFALPMLFGMLGLAFMGFR